MTPNEYKIKHAAALKNFLSTEAGNLLIPALKQLNIPATVHNIPHVHQANLDRRAGHELCEKNLLFLSSPPVPNEEIEMTYGVNDKK